jgi:hypothetical protein
MTSFDDVKDELQAVLASNGGRSLVKLGFIALKVMMRAGLPARTWRMTPWQSALTTLTYSGLDNQYTAAKLLIQIHTYLLDLDVDVVDVTNIGPETNIGALYCALRRQLNVLRDGNTKSRPKPEPPKKVELPDIVLDVNNRFSILFEAFDAKDNDSFYIDDEVDIPLTNELTLDERRYVTQARANSTRKKMGYPPKGKADLDSKEFLAISEKTEKAEADRVIANRVLRPLCRWRRDFLIPFKEGKLPKEDLTIVPLTLLGVYEQMYKEYNSLLGLSPILGCIDGVPRVWDTGPPPKGGPAPLSFLAEVDGLIGDRDSG